MQRLIQAFLVVLASALAQNARAGALCQDARIPPPGAGGTCETYSLLYADQGMETEVQLAKVFRRTARYIDVFIDEYDHYLRRPDGEIVDLGEFRPAFVWGTDQRGMSGPAASFLARRLGIDYAAAREIFHADSSAMLDNRLERVRYSDGRSDRYCITYRMKQPFEGKFRDCDGVSPIVGMTIGYARGTVTWREAKTYACLQVLPDAAGQCLDSEISSRIARDPSNRLFYIFTVNRRWTRSVYRIDATNGAMTVLATENKAEPLLRWLPWFLFGFGMLLGGLWLWRLRALRRHRNLRTTPAGS